MPDNFYSIKNFRHDTTQMSSIVPAILETTKEGFAERMNRVVKLPNLERIQVDFGDGKFIENKLLSAADMDALNPAFHWEAHLMCQAPMDFLDYQICGFKTIIIHYEAYKNKEDVIAALKEIRKLGFKSGLAVNPDTPTSIYSPFWQYVDEYLVMSVVPGKQGQKFIESTCEKITELRRQIPNAIIEVDGGVNETNIKKIKESGVDLICVGSALVKAEDIPAAWEKLHKDIN